jgi:hypothetical protein
MTENKGCEGKGSVFGYYCNRDAKVDSETDDSREGGD